MIYNFPFFPHFYSNPYYSYPQNRVRNVNNMPPINVNNAHADTKFNNLPFNNTETKDKLYSNRNYKNNNINYSAYNRPHSSHFNYYNTNKQNKATNKNNQNNTDNSAKNDKNFFKDERKINDKNDHLDFAFLDPNDTVFEIFGIKLHFDDILLICLIFFLYNEGVKDEFLFIVLVLLLLS